MSSETHSVYLLLGSNIGDRQEHLRQARIEIAHLIGQVIQESQIYVTEAWGLNSQDPFLNQALEIETVLRPESVLRIVQEIEQRHGRTRDVRYGPRTIDIDIAFYDDHVIESKDLTVPHPGIPARNFALIPLIEIAGHMTHPVLRQTLRDLFEQSTDQSEVTILEG